MTFKSFVAAFTSRYCTIYRCDVCGDVGIIDAHPGRLEKPVCPNGHTEMSVVKVIDRRKTTILFLGVVLSVLGAWLLFRTFPATAAVLSLVGLVATVTTVFIAGLLMSLHMKNRRLPRVSSVEEEYHYIRFHRPCKCVGRLEVGAHSLMVRPLPLVRWFSRAIWLQEAIEITCTCCGRTKTYQFDIRPTPHIAALCGWCGTHRLSRDSVIKHSVKVLEVQRLLARDTSTGLLFPGIS